MNHLRTGALPGLLVLALAACTPPADNEEINAKLDQILEKIAALEEGQKQLATQQVARRGPPPEDYSKVYKIDVSGAPILGNPNAPITLVEYSDFECPYCARTAPDLKQLHEKYPDKLRVVYKHFPLAFHRTARPAAIAAVAAQEQGRFWEFHDAVFQATSKRELSEAHLEKYAEQAGLDVERFKQDLGSRREEFEKRVNADYAEGQSVDVRGTPTLYLNGRKVPQRSVAAISQAVDALLKAMEEKKAESG